MRLRLLQAAAVLLALVGLFFAAVIALAVRDLYAQNQALRAHQAATDYQLCTVTRTQEASIRRLAHKAHIHIHPAPLPSCGPPR